MLVDELFIPHAEGSIRVPLDERVTVFAGLDAAARRRFASLVAESLAGLGPGSVRVRDALGQVATIGEPDDAPVAAVSTGLVRRMVVGAHDLGLDEGAPDPVREAERTATTMAHRQLQLELAAIEAGAEEADRLRAELETAPWLQAFDGAGAAEQRPSPTTVEDQDEAHLEVSQEDLDVVEHLLMRRRAAEDLLAATAEAVRSTDPRHSRTDANARPHDAGTGLLDAVAALRRVEARRLEVETIAPQAAAVSAALSAEAADARTALRRAATEMQDARRAAADEVRECDHALADLAEELGIEVDEDGPAPSLSRALAPAPSRPEVQPLDPELERLLRRRQDSLRARIAELPTDDDVAAARSRVAATAAHLERLGGPTGTLPVERIRNVLLARAAALRPDGIDCAVPLVLDDPLVRLEPGVRCDLLDVVARISDRTQVVMLTGDPVVASWARRRAERGEVRLFDLALTPAR